MNKNLKKYALQNALFLIPLMLGLFVFIKTSVFHPFSPDSWTHMGIGKFIVENKKIPLHSDISFKENVLPSLEWVSHSWLSDIFFHLSGSVNTLYAGFLVVLPILLLSLYFLYKILFILRIGRRAIWLPISIPTIIAGSFWKIHPFPIATLLLLCMLFLYLKWREGSKKSILLIPVIFVLFANMSGGFVFIPLFFFTTILLTETVYRIVVRLIKQKTTTQLSIKFLSLSFFLSIPSLLINPYGLRLFIYPLTFFGILERKSWFSSLSGSLLLTNQNFLRNAPSSFLNALFLVLFIFILCMLFYIAIKKKNLLVKYYYLAPLLLFFTLPLLWVRFIPLSTFLTLPLLGVITAELFKNKAKLLVYAYIVILSISAFYMLYRPYTTMFDPPITHIEIIKKFNLPLNVLTSQDITGYTLHSLPGKVGLDAQDDVFDENELITTFSPILSSIPNDSSGFQSTLEENEIGTVLVNKNIGDLAYLFNNTEGWALIYFDDNGFLFSKKEFLDDEFIKKNEIKYLELGRNLGFEPENATESAQELEVFTKRYPTSYLALGQLASVYRYQKDLKKAEETLLKIPDNKWNYVTMTEMARLRAAQGYCKSSEKWFLEALNDRSEKNFSRAVLDLAVLYAGCLNDYEKAKHFLLRYNSFQLSPIEREKVKQIANDFNIQLEE